MRCSLRAIALFRLNVYNIPQCILATETFKIEMDKTHEMVAAISHVLGSCSVNVAVIWVNLRMHLHW